MQKMQTPQQANQTISERLYTVSEVLRLFNISRHRLVYLFDCRKLKREEFPFLPNGHICFRESDIEKTKKVLFEVQAK
ncbi:MAG: hypothetical protein A2Y09_10580 [Planctomycetes bacterium GWA2_39_15]|nr:MAG: hypothetical protein A2Y09_10580 [Planctomycetes bacterium GWA2_39_15]OHB41068.1 MAG: hypothetical protein A2Y11_06545 [Planctomycetes bacterium GWC2_39_26]